MTIGGCVKATTPDDVYCLLSTDKNFQKFVRLEVKKTAAAADFSYSDASDGTWAEINSFSDKRTVYNPLAFIDLLVENDDTYIAMINSISEKSGTIRVSIFYLSDADNKLFAEKLKRGLLGGAPGLNPIFEGKCGG